MAQTAGRPIRIWVTRPEEDAGPLEARLRAAGTEPWVEPLLSIVWFEGPPLSLDGVQALLATSANGMRAFARRNPERHLPVLAVGDATARAARDLGFSDVERASGDVTALTALVRRRLDPAAGTLLHPAATDLAGDLGAALLETRFTYRREILYRATPAGTLSERTRRTIGHGEIEGIVVFSPRTGRTLAGLLADAGLQGACTGMTCYCLSEAVAASLCDLPWRRVVVAARPEQDALIDAIAAGTAGAPTDSAVDLLSATGYFTHSRGDTNGSRRTGDGGMTSETSKDQQQPWQAAPTGAAHPPAGEESGRPASSGQPVEPDVASEEPRVELTTQEGTPGAAPARETLAVEPWSRGDRGEAARPESGLAAAAGEAQKAGPSPGRVAAAEPPRRGSGALWPVVVLGVLAAAGAAAWYGYEHFPTAEVAEVQPAPREAEVDAALTDLDGRHARLKQQVDALQPRIDALENNLASLRQSIEQISPGGGEVIDPQAIQQLGDRIARLESQAANATSLAQQVRSLEVSTSAARETASKLATTVLAAGQLTQAMDTGGPFVRPLATVRALGGDDPDIAQAAAALEPLASTGIPTLSALRARFPEVAHAVAAAAPATAGETWSNRVIDRVASVVTVRRTGSEAIAAGGVDGILAKAETALGGGDLQAAVTALEGLEGQPARAASDWIEQAKARLAAERAAATLQQRAIARLSAAKG